MTATAEALSLCSAEGSQVLQHKQSEKYTLYILYVKKKLKKNVYVSLFREQCFHPIVKETKNKKPKQTVD